MLVFFVGRWVNDRYSTILKIVNNYKTVEIDMAGNGKYYVFF